jgi:hypothetical protein
MCTFVRNVHSLLGLLGVLLIKIGSYLSIDANLVM